MHVFLFVCCAHCQVLNEMHRLYRIIVLTLKRSLKYYTSYRSSEIRPIDQALLSAAGDQTSPGLSDLLPITLVRNMTVDLLPARVGELVFVGLLKRTNNTHVGHSLACLLFATLA